MRNIVYDIHSKRPLIIGYAGEHNADSVTFKGFKKQDDTATLYFMLYDVGLIPLVDDAVVINYNYTQTEGSFEGYLVEIKSDNTLINKSNNFEVIIKHSYPIGDIVPEETPELDLWYSKMGELYNTVKTAYESGELNGKDGEDGEDGVSPTITTETITGGHRITITDVEGSKTVDVLDGEKGDTGETGPAGPTGSAGKDGADGTSVSITSISESTESGGTSTVTFSDGKSLGIKNGLDGRNGADGSDADVTHDNVVNALGYTPANEETVSKDLSNLDEKKVGYSEVVNGQLIMYSDSTKEHLLATLDLPQGTVTDVKVDNTSVVSDGIASLESAKAELTDTSAEEWTETEQKAAQARIGLASGKDWVLKGTITTDNKDDGVTVDLSDCTELLIYGIINTSASAILKTDKGSFTSLLNGNMCFRTYGINVNDKYCTLSAKYGSSYSLGGWMTNFLSAYDNHWYGLHQFTNFAFNTPANVTKCEIYIYAR